MDVELPMGGYTSSIKISVGYIHCSIIFIPTYSNVHNLISIIYTLKLFGEVDMGRDDSVSGTLNVCFLLPGGGQKVTFLPR